MMGRQLLLVICLLSLFGVIYTEESLQERRLEKLKKLEELVDSRQVLARWNLFDAISNLFSSDEKPSKPSVKPTGSPINPANPAKPGTPTKGPPSQSGSTQQGTCGKPAVQPLLNPALLRIVNGVEAKPHSWPWQVYLELGQFSCGGSIIDKQWILTAAHCAEGMIKTGGKWNTYVGVGLHGLNDIKYEQIYLVQDRFIYEKYSERTMSGDIMLLKLDRAITFNKDASPVCLPKLDENFSIGTVCYASGWGKTEKGSGSTTLRQARVPIVAYNNCPLTKNMPLEQLVCAGYIRGGQDTCQGDSGGPLVTMQGDRWVLVGVTSYGAAECGVIDNPGVYARVSYFISWINDKIAKN